MLVISSDSFNTSRLATVIAVVLTSNTGLAMRPGNVFIPAAASGLPKDSVVNMTALVTLNKNELGNSVGVLTVSALSDVDRGLRASLSL